MKKLNNRKTAILITVVVAILAALFGVNRSLGAEAGRIERMFYDGVYLEDEKYTQPSIDSQLKKREQSAYTLTTLTEKYDGLGDMTNELLAARDMLRHAVHISEKGEANTRLQSAFDELYNAFLTASPNERDRKLAEEYAATFYGAGATIGDSRYNQEVYKFVHDLSGEFPTGLIKPLIFTSEPETF